jgi:dCMP deaminase
MGGWMGLAAKAATASDPGGRQVGALIVGAFGNRLEPGWAGIQSEHGVVACPPRLDKPEKYYWSEHAERRAIAAAAAKGWALEGATIYVTWFPCMDCARMIVGTRMAELVYGREPDLDDPKFGEDFKRVKDLLTEAKVKFRCEPVEEN